MIRMFKKFWLVSSMILLAALAGTISLPTGSDGYVQADGDFVFCNSYQEVLEWKDADVGKPFRAGASISEKDDAGKIGRYLFTVETVSNRKMFKELDLTEKSGLWNLAILVDDATTVTIDPQDGTPATTLPRCQGSALWSDAAFHLLPYSFNAGKIYLIKFDYSNTCHLPHPDIMEDYDGVIAYLYPSSIDLDADLNGDGKIDADDEAMEEIPGGHLAVGDVVSPLQVKTSGFKNRQLRLRWTCPELVEVKKDGAIVSSGLLLTPDTNDRIYDFTVKALDLSVNGADIAFTLEAVDDVGVYDQINFTVGPMCPLCSHAAHLPIACQIAGCPCPETCMSTNRADYDENGFPDYADCSSGDLQGSPSSLIDATLTLVRPVGISWKNCLVEISYPAADPDLRLLNADGITVTRQPFGTALVADSIYLRPDPENFLRLWRKNNDIAAFIRPGIYAGSGVALPAGTEAVGTLADLGIDETSTQDAVPKFYVEAIKPSADQQVVTATIQKPQETVAAAPANAPAAAPNYAAPANAPAAVPATNIAGFVTDGQSQIKVKISEADLDVDSDNSGILEGSDAEDAMEDVKKRYGKIIPPANSSDSDADNDGIPDFADGFDLEPAKDGDSEAEAAAKKKDDDSPHALTPVVVRLAGNVDLAKAKLTLQYPASNPASVGVTTRDGVRTYTLPVDATKTLRLWRERKDKDGKPLGLSRRNKNLLVPAKVPEGQIPLPAGDYLAPGVYGPADLAELGFTETSREVTLWLEGVRSSRAPGDGRIVVDVDPDGDGPLPKNMYGDAVRVTVAKMVDLDMDSDNGDEDDDGESMERSHLEDSLEEADGALGASVFISDGDADGNGIADPDDLNSPHWWLAPAWLEFAPCIDFNLGKATVTFRYSADIPGENNPKGAMRLWFKNGARSESDFIRPDVPYQIFGTHAGLFQFFVEGIRPLPTGMTSYISVEIDPDGPQGPLPTYSDKVKVRLLPRKAPVRTTAPDDGIGWVNAAETGAGAGNGMAVGAGMVSGTPAVGNSIDAVGLMFRVKCSTGSGTGGAIGESWIELHKEMPSAEIFSPRSLKFINNQNVTMELSAGKHEATICLPDNDRIRFHFNNTTGAEEATARDHHRLYMLRLEREAENPLGDVYYRLRSPLGSYIRFLGSTSSQVFQVKEIVTAANRSMTWLNDRNLWPNVSASSLGELRSVSLAGADIVRVATLDPEEGKPNPRGFDITCCGTTWRIENAATVPDDFSKVQITRLNPLPAPALPLERYLCEYDRAGGGWKITVSTPGTDESEKIDQRTVELFAQSAANARGGFTIPPFSRHPYLVPPTEHDPIDISAKVQILTQKISGRADSTTRTVTKRVSFLPGGDHFLDEKVLDPGGANQKNTFTYGSFKTDIFNGIELKRKLLKSMAQGNGLTAEWEHDDVGRVTSETSPMADGNKLEVLHDFSPMSPADKMTSNDNRFRKETRKLGGVVVGIKWFGYGIPQNDGKTLDIIETASSQGASLGTAGNLKDTVLRYGLDYEDPFLRGLPVRTISSDGVFTSYEYSVSGTQVTSTATALRLANPGDTVPMDKQIGKTVRSISVIDGSGRKLSERLQMWVQPPPLKPEDPPPPAEWRDTGGVSISYDAAGRVMEEKNLVKNVSTKATWDLYGKNSYADETGSVVYVVSNIHHEKLIETRGRHKTIYVRNAVGDPCEIWVGDINGDRNNDLIRNETQNTFDGAGRILTSKMFGGKVTTFSYQNGPPATRTITNPDGTTDVSAINPDGSPKSTGGNIAVNNVNQSGVNGDGTVWTMKQVGADTSSTTTVESSRLPCVKETCDFIGRPWKIEIPDTSSSNAVRIEEITYDTFGRRIRVACHVGTVSLPALLIKYDASGEPWRAGLDVNRDDQLTPNSKDRFVEYSSVCDGTWIETAVRVYSENNAQGIEAGRHRKRVSGFADGLVSETESVDSRGRVTRNAESVSINQLHPGAFYTCTTQPGGNQSSSFQDGFLTTFADPSGRSFTCGYDVYGRRTSVTDSHGRVSSIAYNDNGQIASTTDADGHVTSYAYDPDSGEIACVTDPMGGTTRYKYDHLARKLRVWGTATVPVEIEYDIFQRPEKHTTFRAFRGQDSATWPGWIGSGDTTTWKYDVRTGVLLERKNALGGCLRYEYGPFCRLEKRTLENNTSATYEYNDLGDLAKVDYSDVGTPDLNFTYDGLGRLLTVADGQGTRTFSYDGLDQLAAETLPGLPNRSISRTYDALGLMASVAVAADNYQADFTYDGYGRLATAKRGTDQLSLGYHQETGMVATVSGPHGILISKDFESNHDLVTRLKNQRGESLVAQFDCQYDALQRLTRIEKTGITVITPQHVSTFAYSQASELTREIVSKGLPEGFRAVEFGYDAIGNRRAATPGLLDAQGNVTFPEGATTAYAANSLNQLFPGQPQPGLSYNTNGNATVYGGWNYEWDGENRLTQAACGNKAVQCKYDYMSRRVEKKVFENNILVKHIRFVYDGFRLIEELDVLNGSVPVRSYLWRNDVLASMRIHRTAEEGGDLELYYFHDLNRNVIALMDRAGTQPAARYEYTAFGELTVCEGTWATANPFRFSNEYWDDDLGLVYYNYRYYAPAIGRWLSADPIGLAGGSNLYAMLGNNPVNFTDYLGLMEGGTDQAMAIMGKNVVYQSIDGQYHNFPQGFVKDHLDKAKTWAKATGNSLQQACSFGVWGPDYYAFGEPSLRDKVNGYETAAIVSRIGSELALGWITGYGGTMVFAAKLTIGMRFACGAMFIIDSSRNLYDTYQGVMAIAENGLSFQSSLQLFGGAFGLSGNIAGFTRGLSKVDGIINKDVEYLFKHAKYKTTPMDECFKGMIKGENSIWRKKNTLVEYFGKKGRQACKINIIDGKLYDVAGKVFDTTGEGEMIYVMDEIGEIFAKRGISGQIHHSSFFAGQPVAAAGSIIVKDGVIHDITSNSGHYVPEEEFYQQVLQELRSRGANLNNLRR